MTEEKGDLELAPRAPSATTRPPDRALPARALSLRRSACRGIAARERHHRRHREDLRRPGHERHAHARRRRQSKPRSNCFRCRSNRARHDALHLRRRRRGTAVRPHRRALARRTWNREQLLRRAPHIVQRDELDRLGPPDRRRGHGQPRHQRVVRPTAARHRQRALRAVPRLAHRRRPHGRRARRHDLHGRRRSQRRPDRALRERFRRRRERRRALVHRARGRERGGGRRDEGPLAPGLGRRRIAHAVGPAHLPGAESRRAPHRHRRRRHQRRRDDPLDLLLPRGHAGLGRHRLQLSRRQVRQRVGWPAGRRRHRGRPRVRLEQRIDRHRRDRHVQRDAADAGDGRRDREHHRDEVHAVWAAAVRRGPVHAPGAGAGRIVDQRHLQSAERAGTPRLQLHREPERRADRVSWERALFAAHQHPHARAKRGAAGLHPDALPRHDAAEGRLPRRPDRRRREHRQPRPHRDPRGDERELQDPPDRQHRRRAGRARRAHGGRAAGRGDDGAGAAHSSRDRQLHRALGSSGERDLVERALRHAGARSVLPRRGLERGLGERQRPGRLDRR